MNKLLDKVALITGGSRGIGKAISIALAKEGAKIVVNYYQNEKAAHQVIKEIENIGGKAICFRADVSDFESVKAMVNSTIKKFKKIDILVNNAGVNFLKPILEISNDQWDKILGINLKGVFNCCKCVIKNMMERRSGKIINISSVSGKRGGFSGDVDYSASKSGILGFTLTLARYVASYGINVNSIAPGYIETDAWQDVPAKKRSELEKSIPMGRIGKPSEVASVVVFLASDDSNYITGEIININGGVYMQV